MSSTFYVYALKDTRQTPAKIFYIGKGTGSRATSHLLRIDNTRKGQFIQQILGEGSEVCVSKIVDNLTEEQALSIELELITSFGTIDTGGILLNTVIPKTVIRKVSKDINVAPGCVEKAQLGLKLLKDSILFLSEENPQGITNSDCSHYLGLQSDNEGNQKDYLSYSVLGLLLKEGTIESCKIGNRRTYKRL